MAIQVERTHTAAHTTLTAGGSRRTVTARPADTAGETVAAGPAGPTIGSVPAVPADPADPTGGAGPTGTANPTGGSVSTGLTRITVTAVPAGATSPTGAADTTGTARAAITTGRPTRRILNALAVGGATIAARAAGPADATTEQPDTTGPAAGPGTGIGLDASIVAVANLETVDPRASPGASGTTGRPGTTHTTGTARAGCDSTAGGRVPGIAGGPTPGCPGRPGGPDRADRTTAISRTR